MVLQYGGALDMCYGWPTKLIIMCFFYVVP